MTPQSLPVNTLFRSSRFNLIDDRVLGDIGDNLQALRLARALGPGRDGAVRVGIDKGDGSTFAGQFRSQDDSGGRLAGAALRAGEDDGRHREALEVGPVLLLIDIRKPTDSYQKA